MARDPEALREVSKAAAKAAAALSKRDASIRSAYGQGLALRKIADAAGVSHEQVRRILSR